jgi:hypothetical protein
MWQSVGTAMPTRRAACRSVAPAGASTCFPLMVRETDAASGTRDPLPRAASTRARDVDQAIIARMRAIAVPNARGRTPWMPRVEGSGGHPFVPRRSGSCSVGAGHGWPLRGGREMRHHCPIQHPRDRANPSWLQGRKGATRVPHRRQAPPRRERRCIRPLEFSPPMRYIVIGGSSRHGDGRRSVMRSDPQSPRGCPRSRDRDTGAFSRGHEASGT